MSPSPEEDHERFVRVVSLLDESFHAFSRGDTAEHDRAAAAACALDVDYVGVVHGGLLLGEIPDPQSDPDAWSAWVADVRAIRPGAS